MRNDNSKLNLTMGLGSLALALIVERFFPSNSGLNFIEGFLIGISMVFNLKYLLSFRKTQQN